MTIPVIKLTPQEWHRIRNLIRQEFHLQPAVLLISEVMRRELGFTSRYHRYWQPDPGYDGHGQYVEEIHLDFYDESSPTMFRLKYL